MRLNKAVLMLACFATVLLGRAAASDEGLRNTAESPVISPSGTKLLFAVNTSTGRDIWISEANGSNAAALMAWPDSDEKQPAWSPDGTRIVFSSNRGSEKHQIWTVNPDGSNAIALTADNDQHEQPRYSPDGASIMYLSNGTGKREIWLMNADGSDQRSIALISSRISDPTWSPDGQQIAYVGCRRGGACSLFRINANGSSGAQITTGDFQDWNPDWGVQGIIFASNRGGAQGLWVVQAEGTGLQQVTAPDGAGDLYPHWINGTSGFVFSRSGVSNTDAASDVWAISTSGSVAKRLTTLVADATPPVIVPVVSGTLGLNGWYTSKVTITWQITDPESGIASSTGCAASAFSSDTAGITIACSATNGAGITASKTTTIRIDQKPPEAFGEFDTQRRDFELFGKDILSGVGGGPVIPLSVVVLRTGQDRDDDDMDMPDANDVRIELRTYRVTDLAGNQSTVVVKVKKRDTRIRAKIISLRYGSGPTARLPRNRVSINWKTTKAGGLFDLEQIFQILDGKDAIRVSAVFAAQLNKTFIEEAQQGRKIRTVKVGLALLRVLTNGGKILINY